MDAVGRCVERLVYWIGPVLIVVALGIISLLTYSFVTVLVPMIRHKHNSNSNSNDSGGKNDAHRSVGSLLSNHSGDVVAALHCAWVSFLLVNILYNYAYCVFTRNDETSSEYPGVVQEYADACNFVLPTSPEDVSSWKREYEDKMVLRLRRRRASAEEEQQRQQRQTATASQQQVLSQREQLLRQSNAIAADAAAAGVLVDLESGGGGTSSAATGTAASTATATGQNANVTYRRGAAGANGQLPSSTTAVSETNNNMNGGGSAHSNSASQQQQQVQLQQQQPPPRRWMLMGPYEWGYCSYSNLPKPPRSHYDHVTKRLVLNLDHYCPWMFNSIGYFNYRYFVNFLIWIFYGMMYGVLVTLQPFLKLGGSEYQFQWGEQQHLAKLHGTSERKAVLLYNMERIGPMVPFRHERMLLTLSFMLCAAVGCAVLLLGGFHVYLTVTAQTTIEFHGNMSNRKRAKAAGSKWQNPYSRGSYWRNWQQVYGQRHRHWFTAILPSPRLPDALPAPVPGHSGLRKHVDDEKRQQKKEQQHRSSNEHLLLLERNGVNVV